MDSLNLQSTEDQLNGLGQTSVDQQNFIANYNSGLMTAYTQVKTVTIWRSLVPTKYIWVMPARVYMMP